MALHDAYVELLGLRKEYPGAGGPNVIVEDFSLGMAMGEFVSIIGHSGCGKSTVLMMLAGLTRQTSGRITVGGADVTRAGPERGVVFQTPSLLPWMSAADNVLLGVSKVMPCASAKNRREVALAYLALVGLGEGSGRLPAEMSAGTRQRVGIARAFALRPKVLLLDEPFGMLDQLTRMDLQDVLAGLCERDHRTALMVTHDVDEALYLSDRIVMMTNGPRATIGKVLAVPFARPRNRAAVLEHPGYQRLREELIGFLEEQDASHGKDRAPATSADVDLLTPSPT